jgi:hypothetical protein
MTKDQLWFERVKCFLLGILAVVGLLFLLGADNAPPPHYGRYQISAWSGSLGKDSGGVGAFVIDTVSGEAKTVYTRIYGKPGKGKIHKNNLKMPFASMQ